MAETGRTALVTGAGGGIGSATARKLAEAGFGVLVTDRNADRLAALRHALAPGRHSSIVCDLDDVSSRASLIDRIGTPDLLVNAAGWFRGGPLGCGSEDDVRFMFEVNVLATISICRVVASRMAERGQGHIVIISSAVAREVRAGAVVYSATKHALTAVTRGLRLEYGRRGVHVTEVRPGLVRGTHFHEDTDDPTFLDQVTTRGYDPIETGDVADTVVYAVTRRPGLEIQQIDVMPLGQT